MEGRYTPRFAEYQRSIAEWKQALNPPETEEPIKREFQRHVQEDLELFEAIEEGDNEAIAGEAVDGIIGLLQIIEHTGFNVDELLSAKLEVMQEKYPPEEHMKLRDEGMSFEDAMEYQKTLYKGRLEVLDYKVFSQ